MPSASRPDHEVLHDLWVDHARPVSGYLVRRVGRQEAEDLTSEVFVRAAGALGRYEDRGVPVQAWLITIARNLAVERSRKSWPGVLDVTRAEVPVEDHQEAVVHRTEQAAALGALGQLPPAHQEVLDLRYIRELSVAETAEVLGLSAGAVRARTYRALNGLRDWHRQSWPESAAHSA